MCLKTKLLFILCLNDFFTCDNIITAFEPLSGVVKNLMMLMRYKTQVRQHVVTIEEAKTAL